MRKTKTEMTYRKRAEQIASDVTVMVPGATFKIADDDPLCHTYLIELRNVALTCWAQSGGMPGFDMGFVGCFKPCDMLDLATLWKAAAEYTATAKPVAMGMW